MSASASAPDFNRIARAYKWMEYISFGTMLEHCRFAMLPYLASSQQALILGDGDGRFLAGLLQANPGIQADVIDSSASMQFLSRERTKKVGAAQRACFYCHDIHAFQPVRYKRYDLVVTHFFLDCLTGNEVEELVQRLLPALHSGTFWLVSEFAIPESGPMHLLATVLVRTLYFAFRLLTGLSVRTLPDYSSAFAHAGFTCIRSTTFLGGILRSELWQLF